MHGKSRPGKNPAARTKAAKAKATAKEKDKQDSKTGKRRHIDTEEYSWQTTVRDFVDSPSFDSITNPRFMDRTCFDQIYLHQIT